MEYCNLSLGQDMADSQDGWFRNARGNLCKVYGAKPRGESKRADLAVPMMIRDFDEPVQSMADGKFYGSKAALSRSHKAANNPSGQDFVEVGNEVQTFTEYKPDLKSERDVLRQAAADVAAGWTPESVALDF